MLGLHNHGSKQGSTQGNSTTIRQFMKGNLKN